MCRYSGTEVRTYEEHFTDFLTYLGYSLLGHRFSPLLLHREAKRRRCCRHRPSKHNWTIDRQDRVDAYRPRRCIFVCERGRAAALPPFHLHSGCFRRHHFNQPDIQRKGVLSKHTQSFLRPNGCCIGSVSIIIAAGID